MSFDKLTVLAGHDKNGQPEQVKYVELHRGETLAIVGPTGSGKTQLISDIEQYADGETSTGRSLLVDDRPIPETNDFLQSSGHMVAEVSQKMNFVIDTTVHDFLLRHANVRQITAPESCIRQVLEITNSLTGEPVAPSDNLTALSGGQTRALMVGDVALISNAPIVLIDEIENAGIDRLSALKHLSGQGKIVLVVTHDLTLSLMSGRRMVMKNGGMSHLHTRTADEHQLMETLLTLGADIQAWSHSIKSGQQLSAQSQNKGDTHPWPQYCSIAH